MAITKYIVHCTDISKNKTNKKQNEGLRAGSSPGAHKVQEVTTPQTDSDSLVIWGTDHTLAMLETIIVWVRPGLLWR